jgi:putative flippase GtrA
VNEQNKDLSARQILLRRFASFGSIGLGLTIFGWIFIEVSVRLGESPERANFWQAIISVALNFVFNNATTWQDRRDLSLGSRIGRYLLAKAISIPLNQILFVFALKFFDTTLAQHTSILSNTTFAYFASTGAIMVYNYVVGDKFVFRKKKG